MWRGPKRNFTRRAVASNLSSREKLKPRRKPYFRALDRELHLGYRSNRIGGVWVLRWYRGDGQYATEGIGTADDNIDADGAIGAAISHANRRDGDGSHGKKGRS